MRKQIWKNSPPRAVDLLEAEFGQYELHLSTDELVQDIYGDISFDVLPWEFTKNCLDHGYDPRGKFVWGYPKGFIFGGLLPLTADAAKEIPAKLIPVLSQFLY